MGNSWQEALKAAIKKAEKSPAKGKESTPKKKRLDNPTKEDATKTTTLTEPQADQQQQDQCFSAQMKKMGVKAAQFKKTHIIRSKGTVAQQGIPAIAQTKPATKRVVKIDLPVVRETEKPAALKITERKVSPKPAQRQSPIQQRLKKPTTPSAKPQPLQSLYAPDPYTIEVIGHIAANPVLTVIPKMKNPLIPDNDGISEQLFTSSFEDEREVVIGLDFGTSCVKVVISDLARSKSFAVPFSGDIGLSSYLLPSRVWIDKDRYTLAEEGVPRQNLKLSLIDPECGADHFVDAAAFLALVIRRSRGWLFSNYADTYRKIRIYWKLTLGLPSATYDDKTLVEKFKNLAATAWLIAGHKGAYIYRKEVNQVCKEARAEGFAQFHKKHELVDTEFSVIPELSAQIYGFLISTKFDEAAQNIFMMVDVGAGTVDSSVFKVTNDKRKKPRFEFFSNIVEQNGVTNLHVERVKWFRHAFKTKGLLKQVNVDFDAIETLTDKIDGIPERLDDYFYGVELSFGDEEVNPDHVFYKKRVLKQVVGKTLKGARSIVQGNRKPKPLFLCGGGSRMKLYQNLVTDLLSHPNATWFCFRPQKLEVPNILSVPGVKQDEFDRLSVAFGLSVLNVAEYKRTVEPRPSSQLKSDWDRDPRRCPWCNAKDNCYCG